MAKKFFTFLFFIFLLSSLSSLALSQSTNETLPSNETTVYNQPNKRYSNSVKVGNDLFNSKSYQFKLTDSEKWYDIKTKKLNNGNIKIRIKSPTLSNYNIIQYKENGYIIEEKDNTFNNRKTNLEENYDEVNISKKKLRIYNEMPVYNKQGELIDELDPINNGVRNIYEYEINPILQEYVKFGENSIVADFSTDLISYYELNNTSGDVIDSHGTNDGTNNGATRGVTGKINNAFDFDGTDDYVSVSNNFFNDGDDVTISLWLNWDTAQSGTVRPIDKETTNEGYSIFIDDGELSGKVGDGSNNYKKSGDSLNDDTGSWEHIVMVIDSGNQAYLYHNATQVTSWSIGSFQAPITENLSIGARDNTQQYIDGQIDEVGIWNRALSSTEVSDLYNSGSGTVYEETTNQAPNQPTNPNPSNNSNDISINTDLEVDVSDPEGDSMNITYYWENGTVIDTINNVASGSTAISKSLNLSGDTSYSWYVEADDGQNTTTSDIWTFNTEYIVEGIESIASNFSDNLVLYYEMEETAQDNPSPIYDSYSNKDGTSDLDYRNVSGKINQAYNFSGSFEYGGTPDLISGNTGTVNFWIKPHNAQGTRREDIAGFKDTSGSVDGIEIKNYNNGETYLEINVDGQTFNQSITDSYPDGANNWLMVTATWDTNNGEYYLYWNAQEKISTTSGITGAMDTNTRWGIASSYIDSSWSNFYDGIFDEFGLWNKALNSTEILELYNNGNAVPYGNVKPDQPTNPNPSDNSVGVDFNTDLEVDVSDPEGDSMNITYYWENGTVIDTINNVASGSTAISKSLDLGINKSYSWYVNVTDGKEITQSDIWTFNTSVLVETLEAENVTETTSELKGNLNLGGLSSVDAYFQYKKDTDSTWTNTTINTYSSDGEYSEVISIEINENYEFRAIAETTDETVIGDIKTFSSAQEVTLTDSIPDVDIYYLEDETLQLDNYFIGEENYGLNIINHTASGYLQDGSQRTFIDGDSNPILIVDLDSNTGQLDISSHQEKDIEVNMRYNAYNDVYEENDTHTITVTESPPSTYINNWTQLNDMRNDLSRRYVLNNSLDRTTDGYSTYGENWNTISGEYTGDFENAGNYVIEGLGINNTNNNVGLFENISGTFEDITFVDAEIYSGNNVGIIAGNILSGGIVRNIRINSTDPTVAGSKTIVDGTNNIGLISGTNNGDIKNIIVNIYNGEIGADNYGGGITGINYGSINSIDIDGSGIFNIGKYGGSIAGDNQGNINNAFSDILISGAEELGGISGKNSGTINSTYNNGNIQAESYYAGGIVGRNTGTIKNSYFGNANVNSFEYSGGIVGENSNIIENTYVLGTLESDFGDVGAIASINTGTISNSYWNTETSGISGGNTTEEMKNISLYNPEWDITDVSSESDRDTNYIWNIVDGESYPFLSNQVELISEPETITPILTNPINDFNMSYNEITNVYLNQHFNNTDEYRLYVNSSDGEYVNVIIDEGESFEFAVEDGDQVRDTAIISLSNDGKITIESYDEDYSFSNIRVNAWNPEGDLDEEFKMSIVESSENPYNPPETVDENAPELISEIGNIDIEDLSELNIDLSNHFNNFDYTYIILDQFYPDQDIRIDEGESQYVYVFDEENNETVQTSKVSLSENSILTITTYYVTTDYLDLQEKHKLDVYAVNDDGKAFSELNYDILQEITDDDEEYTSPTTEITDGKGILGTITNSFLGILPDSKDMSATQSMAFVVVVMMLVPIIIMLPVYSSAGTMPIAVLYLVIALESLLFAFFTATGYIPISVLIIVILSVMAFSYFKLFHQTGGE